VEPRLILQVGRSISFAPERGEGLHLQSLDSRRQFAEIDPEPCRIAASCGSTRYDLLTALGPADDSFGGTRISNPEWLHGSDERVSSALAHKAAATAIGHAIRYGPDRSATARHEEKLTIGLARNRDVRGGVEGCQQAK
jgi:hypothetical protein